MSHQSNPPKSTLTLDFKSQTRWFVGDATSCLPAVDQERAGVVLLVGILEFLSEPEEEGASACW